jgi:hypothetical protein
VLGAVSIAAWHPSRPGGTGLGSGDLAPFLAEKGLRPGAALAALLLALPFATLARQALRVGTLALDRQADILTLVGATPGDLRHLRMARNASAFGRGGLLAGPVYGVLWLVLGLAPPAGKRLLPVPQDWLPLAWLATAGALVLMGAAIGAGSHRRSGHLASPTSSAGHAPEPVIAWLSGLGAVAVLLSGLRADSLTGAGTTVVVLVAVVLSLVCVSTMAARRVARAGRAPEGISTAGPARRPCSARRRLVGNRGSANPAIQVLAAAQRRGNPRAAGAVAGVLFVCGASFGFEAVFLADLVVGYTSEDRAFYVGGTLVAATIGAVAAAVALAALALNLTDHLLSARRSVASTAALGAEPAQLVEVQARALAMTAVPATATGALLATPYALAGADLVVVLGSVAAAVGLSTALVGLACRLLARLLAGRVRAAAALENLRIP